MTTTSGDRPWKRTVHVPMCLLRVANARIRKVLHGLRTNKSEAKRTASELDESIARPHSRYQSEIEGMREEEDELLKKAIMDNATISRLINEQKYMAEQTLCLKEVNEKLQRELKMANDTVIDLAETNEKLVNHIRHVEIKCLEQEVQLKDLGVATTAAFAGKTAAVKSAKVTVTTAAAAVPVVYQTAPLQSVLKTTAMDRSRKKPECVSDLRLQVNNNHVRISIFLCARYTMFLISSSVQLILKNRILFLNLYSNIFTWHLYILYVGEKCKHIAVLIFLLYFTLDLYKIVSFRKKLSRNSSLTSEQILDLFARFYLFQART